MNNETIDITQLRQKLNKEISGLKYLQFSETTYDINEINDFFIAHPIFF
jgi:hypothetical protein